MSANLGELSGLAPSVGGLRHSPPPTLRGGALSAMVGSSIAGNPTSMLALGRGALTSAAAPFLTGEAALVGAGLASRTAIGQFGEALSGVYSAATGNTLNAVLSPSISASSVAPVVSQGQNSEFNLTGSGVYTGAVIQGRLRK